MNSHATGTRSLVQPMLALIAVASLLVACSPGVGSAGTVAPPPSSPPASVEPGSPDATADVSPSPSSAPASPSAPASSQPPSGSPSASPAPSSAGTMIVRAYFFLNGRGGDTPGLVAVLREIPRTQAVARAAMTALLDGPSSREASASPKITSAVPDGTKLLGLAIDGSVATVNLSREFESGGGSASVQGRLAQVVYTLTQFSNVKGVRFQLDGDPVTTFGGEGVDLGKPVGRIDFRDQLPSIFVDRPVWGAAAGNPARITGLANVFEATFRVAILDGSGRVLKDQQVMATCGTGCWGTFDVTLTYSVSKAQYGTLRAYNLSAKDGSPEDIRDYPMWLTAA